MDALTNTVQGAVNQANKTSTQNSARTERRHTDAPAGTVQRTEHVAAAELKKRVEQILSQLKESGVKIVATAGNEASKAKESPARDGSNAAAGGGETPKPSAKELAESARLIGDGKPVYPFDKNFLQLNLENMRALVKGDAQIDDDIAGRLKMYVSDAGQAAKAAEPNTEAKPAEAAKSAVEAQSAASIDKMV